MAPERMSATCRACLLIIVPGRKNVLSETLSVTNRQTFRPDCSGRMIIACYPAVAPGTTGSIEAYVIPTEEVRSASGF